MATIWDPIYWDTACLVVNSGSLEEEFVNIYEIEDEDYSYEDLPDRTKKKKKSADYAKVAKAIGDIVSRGINVSLININTSDYGFKPDIENQRILYGLKALSNINEEIIEKIKMNRPYSGIKDFMNKCPLTSTAMINLIKAGAFDEVEKVLSNRKEIMAYYLSKIGKLKNKINLQNWNGLVQYGLVPKDLELQIRVYNFTKYLKANCKVGQYYQFNEICLDFIQNFLPATTDKIEIINGVFCITQKAWDKIYQSVMDASRKWLKENQQEILKKYNSILFKEIWNKYATGNESHWEMDSLCFYHGEHELAHIDMKKYDISDFNNLKTNDVAYLWRSKIPIYNLHKIAGTVIAKNDNMHMITLLTTTGLVNVKFTRDYYAMYKKQISQVQSDGSKKVVEKSWFKRGTLLLITGYRRDDQFVAKTYKNTPTHQLYKIVDIDNFTLQHNRADSKNEIEE